jgi:fibronectin-binding autotransporter adhesin
MGSFNFKLFPLLACLFSQTFFLYSDETVWNGSVTTNWSDSANWSNGLPDSDTAAVFPNLGSSTSTTVIVDDFFTLLGISFDANITSYSLNSSLGGLNFTSGDAAIAVNSSDINHSIFNTPCSFDDGLLVSIDPNSTLEIALAVTGTGGLVLEGGGVLELASNSNNYTGGTTIQGGSTLSINVTDTGTLTFSSSEGGILIIHDGNTFTPDIILNGPGELFASQSPVVELNCSGTISGSSTLSLQGGSGSSFVLSSNSNTYSGNTILSSAITLILNNEDDIGPSGDLVFDITSALTASLQLNTDLSDTARSIQFNAIGTIDVAADQEIDWELSGTGSLIKTGAGTLTLGGSSSSYSGQIEIQESTLSISSDDNLGSGSLLFEGTSPTLDITGSPTLSTSRSVILEMDATFNVSSGTATVSDWSISESGGSYGFTKTGGGTLSLSGTGSYTGDIVISAGTLQGDTDSLTGDIENDSLLIFNQDSASGTYSHLLSGSGMVTKAGSETLTLSAINSDFSGDIVINNGTLAIAYEDNLGTAGDLTFTGFFSPTLELENGANLPTSTRTMNLNADSSTIFVDEGATVSIEWEMIATQVWIKDGAGTLVLGNDSNSFSQELPLQDGTLRISTEASLGGTPSLTFTNEEAILDLEAATLSTTGVHQINVGLGGIFNVNSGADSTVGWVIVDDGPPVGSLTKTGEGVLTLNNGSSSYGGGTSLEAGTLSIATDLNVGSGNITFSSASTLQLTGDLTDSRILTLSSEGTIDVPVSSSVNWTINGGGGALVKTGAGVLTLSAVNSYSSGTQLQEGTLSVADGQSIGSAGVTFTGNGTLSLTGTASLLSSQPIVLEADGIISASGSATIEGNISGNYSLTKQDSGSLTLNGINSYLGGTTVAGGTLIGDTDSLQGNISIETGAIVTFDQGASATYTGVMSGGGSMTKTGTATLTLSGANEYSGGTTVSDGTLQVSTSTISATGNIANNDATLIFNQVDNGVFSGNISGTGTFQKTGVGTLEITGSGSQGSTLISEGEFRINGTWISPTISVASVATLEGAGTLQGNVDNNGILAPGNSIGTINIVGNYIQASNSTLEIEVSPSDSDLVQISGTLTIQSPTTLSVSAETGSYPSPLSYIVMEALGGVSGTFSSVTIPSVLLDASVSYTATEVILSLTPSDISLVVTKGNPGEVAEYLDTLTLSTGSDLDNVFIELYFLQAEHEVIQALDQLHPALFKNFTLENESNSSQIQTLVETQLQPYLLCPACPDQKMNVWWGIWGNEGHQKKEVKPWETLIGYKNTSGGTVLGGDYTFLSQLKTGLFFAYSHAYLSFSNDRGKGNVDHYMPGLYLLWQRPYLYLYGLLQQTWSNRQADRDISFETIQRTAHHHTSSYQGDYLLSLGSPLFWGKWGLTPFISASYSDTHEKGFTESGASSLNLKVNSSHESQWETQVGGHLQYCFCLDRWTLTPDLGGRWIYQMRSGKTLTAHFVNEPGSFTVHGIFPTRSVGALSAELSAALGCFFQTDLRYDFSFANRFSDHNLQLQLKYTW